MYVRTPVTALLFSVFTLVLAACGPRHQVDRVALEAAEIVNFSTPEEMVFAAGQPTPEQIQTLADSGIRHVVSLRTEGEIDWDESSLVNAAGMEFHSIPVAGAAGVTSENAQSLDQLLAQLDGQPVLLHCGSSNRVGALRAMTARDGGASLEDALAEGRRWGMTRMEEAVREILQ